MDLLTTPYTLTLPVWGWCLAVPLLGLATAYAGYYALEALAWLGWRLSRRSSESPAGAVLAWHQLG